MTRSSVLVVPLLLLIAPACTPDEQSAPKAFKGVISIASDMPLSGQFGADGLASVEGVRYALERRGTVRGYQLKFAPYDDSLAGLPEPAKGVQNIQRMLADPRVLGMVGPYTSFAAETEIPVANGGELPMVSPSTTVDCLTQVLPSCRTPPRPSGENNFFRLAAPNTTAGAAMAGFALRSLNLHRLAVLSDGYDDYSDPIATSFSSSFTALGGAVVLRESYTPFTNDFTGVLRRAVQAGAEGLYVAGSTVTGACRIRSQMRSIFPNDAYFLGPDGLVDAPCIRDAGNGADEQVVATIQPAGPRTSDTAARAVVDSFKGRHPDRVGTYTFAALDCALILIDAIRRAIDANGGKLPSRRQVLRAVAATSNFRGVTGTWSFTGAGDATAPRISLYRIHARRWTLWRSVTASGVPED
jgi:branched-chain amino acid transport system substrate-binding protein